MLDKTDQVIEKNGGSFLRSDLKNVYYKSYVGNKPSSFKELGLFEELGLLFY